MTQPSTEELAPGEPARQVYEEIERSGVLPEHLKVQDAVQEVLCGMTRRVAQGSALRLRHSLSEPLGELMRICVVHRGREPERFDREGLLDELSTQLEVSTDQAEQVARAVCAAVHHRFPIEELHRVESQLPGDVAAIWRG